MSAFRARTTQSRYRQASGRVLSLLNPSLSANRARSSQGRAQRSPYCGRGEQAVDQPLVGVGPAVGDEGVDLLGGRRQAGQVEPEAADQGRPVGLGGGGEAERFQLGEDEGVDRVADPRRHPDGGDVGPDGGDERPVPLLLGRPGRLAAAGRTIGRAGRQIAVHCDRDEDRREGRAQVRRIFASADSLGEVRARFRGLRSEDRSPHAGQTGKRAIPT